MKKYECKRCGMFNTPCVLLTGDIVSVRPVCCPFDSTIADWREVKEEKEVKK